MATRAPRPLTIHDCSLTCTSPTRASFAGPWPLTGKELAKFVGGEIEVYTSVSGPRTETAAVESVVFDRATGDHLLIVVPADGHGRHLRVTSNTP